MALIRCRECGKKISELCGVCPNCGCPVEARPTETVSETADRPDAETASKPKKPELTYIQKRNQRIIRVIAAVILVVIGAGFIDATFMLKEEVERAVYLGWYTDVLNNGTLMDEIAEYVKWSDDPSETLLSVSRGDRSGFEEYIKGKLSGEIFKEQFPFYVGGIGCFALSGYLLFSLKKYPLVKRSHA